jgi:hypothetical protein
MSQENEYMNADNFRRWMKSHPESDAAECNMVGLEVQARFGSKKTIRHITIESGRAGRVIREFMEDGGVVEKVSDDDYLVKVESGTFTINKKFVVT